MLDTARKYPFFLFLMPLFYFFHQANEIPAPDIYKSALILVLLFSLGAIVITLLFVLFIKSFRKASLISLFLLCFNFFFGYIHDSVKNLIGNKALFVKYSFIIPFIFLTLVIITILLRKTKNKLENTFLFLNFLLLILISFEAAVHVPKFRSIQSRVNNSFNTHFSKCDSCSKPNIFLIIADEYGGYKELKDILSFDNSKFETDLANRGFNVVKNTNSNYNATVYSLASLLNLEYLNLSDSKQATQDEMLFSRHIINRNSLCTFLYKHGYSIKNHSFFELMDKEKVIDNFYFPTKVRILIFGTFINRFQRDVGFNFLSKEDIYRRHRNDHFNDEIIDSLTKKSVLDYSLDPQFIYTHFSRPHEPHFFDKNGDPIIIEDSLKGYNRIKKGYTELLLFTNKRLLQLIDHILKNSKSPPIIILASDHGFRNLPKGTDKKYCFMNFSAVYLPNKQYDKFYDGMTNVNLFRTILNIQFGQQLPMLKDSTIYLSE